MRQIERDSKENRIHSCLVSCRWVASEGEHWDVEHSVKLRDMQIQELELECSDMRGKFIIPKLKKVHSFKLKEED